MIQGLEPGWGKIGQTYLGWHRYPPTPCTISVGSLPQG